MKYSMFIGRWQPWHKGHRWLIDQRLNENKNVLICIREVSKDDKNPYDSHVVKENIEKGIIDSGLSHFLRFGQREGRVGYKYSSICYNKNGPSI